MQNTNTKLAIRAMTVLVISVAVSFVSAPTQAQTRAAERAANLRAQLADVQAKQTELQTRLQQLDEDIKPENIERSLAGVGSVHPEELREARRRQLEIERRGVQTQLDTLAASRIRLESAIGAADAEAYRQTVGPSANALTTSDNAAPSSQTSTTRQRVKKRRVNKRH